MKKRLKEILARRAEIRALLDGADDAALEAFERELDELDAEEATLNRRNATAERLNRGEIAGNPVPSAPNPITGRGVDSENQTSATLGGTDQRAARLADLQGINVEDANSRAEEFSQEHRMSITSDALYRSLTLSSGSIAQPSRVSGINEAQNQISGLIDMVHIVDATGMGEDSVAYMASGLTAKTKKDKGTATPPSDGDFRIAKITPTLVSTLAYVSKNIQRTTPLNYQHRVTIEAYRALRKIVSRHIVVGDPAATIPEMTGILKAAAVEDGSDQPVHAIDERTLRQIALAYGGDDNVEGGGLLILNKQDLIAFGDIRGTNEKRAVYNIDYDDQSTTVGTIRDGGLAVRFCINNSLPALSASGTANNEYCMVYGKPLAYQLDLFGNYEIEVSRDYKFAEGLVAVMGEVMVGGNVVSHNGFIRVKKSNS